MFRIAINGFGRIGRALFRISENNDFFKIVAINDINNDGHNLAYTLNYDSLYGKLDSPYNFLDGQILNGQNKIKIFSENSIDKINWSSENIDILVDASGEKENAKLARKVLEKNKLKNVIITHSSGFEDFELILGVNQSSLNLSKHKVISSSICDATAIAPVLKFIDEKFEIEYGYITTLHPWLNYQNLLDGRAVSWSMPGTTYEHYPLGRSAFGNMIPKPTTAVKVVKKVLKNLEEIEIGSFSYRTPSAIVSSADISLKVNNPVLKENLIDLFANYQKNQKEKIINNSFEPLISIDFLKSDYSVNIDHRWTDVINGNFIKLILWYDNEWGYSVNVYRQILLIINLFNRS